MAARQLYCGNCGKPLSGKQTKWCSLACGNAGWQKTHPDETRERIRRFRAGQPKPLNPIEQKVVELETEVARIKHHMRRSIKS